MPILLNSFQQIQNYTEIVTAVDEYNPTTGEKLDNVRLGRLNRIDRIDQRIYGRRPTIPVPQERGNPKIIIVRFPFVKKLNKRTSMVR